MPGFVTVLALAAALAACGGDNHAAPANAAPPADPAPAKAYLAEVGHEAGVVTLPSGLEYRVLQSGLATGSSPHASDRVLVNYEARLPSGEVIDSSYARGQPDAFQVGAVVKAWTEALQLMKPGDVWMLYAPPGLAYGDQGAGPVPPGSVLVFKVELIRVLPASVPGRSRRMTAEALCARALPILERLVAFDTTSHLSNLALIEWVERYLAGSDVASRRIASADGRKANLLASIGPAVPGGVVLSGHTDVVPVAGQAWTSDPFELVQRGGRLYGRGSADMKGFIALALAAVPDFADARLTRPIHLAFSYDEETGCFGAPAMIEVIARELPAPALVVVGEPSSMEVISGHKGIGVWRITVTGHEAHSAQTHLGVSAIMTAARLMGALADLAERLERDADPASPYLPGHPTLTIGRVEGGTAGNILARQCVFQFDLRALPDDASRAALAPFFDLARRLDAQIKARAPEGGVEIEQLADVPPLRPDPSGVAEALVRRLAGDNGPARVASFASEAGQFQGAGLPAVLCGPGSIDQAHQPDEYVDVAQMERGAAFMARLAEALGQP